MSRNKRIIILSHCILNQNSVVREWERAEAGFNEIIKIILDKNIAIFQLPCPEFAFLGEDRRPMSKEEYDTTDYRKYNKKLCLSIVSQIAEYKKHDYHLLGIVGISESPSCDTLLHRGVFMEELFAQLKEKKIDLVTFDIQSDYSQDNFQNTEDQFKTWLSSRNNFNNISEKNDKENIE